MVLLLLLCFYSEVAAQDSLFDEENTFTDTTAVSEIPENTDANRFLEPDTLDIPKRISALRYRYDLLFDQNKSIDSSLTNIQYFFPYEKTPNRFKTIGNLGFHHHAVFFQPNLDLHFDWGYNNLKEYDLKQRYFNSPYPITVAHYVIGLYNEQYFQGLHTQNINKYINLLFEYQAVTSEGIYARQFARTQGTLIALDFDSKKRYKNNFTLKLGRKNLQQNGGINNIDLAWTRNPFTKVDVVPISLREAERNNRNRSISIKQSFDLGFEKSRQDSMIILVNDTLFTPNDSTGITDTLVQVIEEDSVFLVNDFYSTFRIFHHFDQSRDSRDYFDPNPLIGYYPAYYTDTLYNNDSIQLNQFTNEVGLLFLGTDFTKKDSSDTKFRAQISAVHEFVRIKSISTRADGLGFTDYRRQQNAFVKLRFFNIDRQFTYDVGFDKGFYGINASGYNAYAKAAYDSPFGEIGFLVQSNRKANDYFFRAIKSNNYFWQTNNLPDISTQKWQGYFKTKDKKWSVKAGQYLVDNYVYFNEEQERRFLGERLLVNQLEIKGHYQKAPWGGNGTLTLQKTNVENFPMPEVMLTASFWYEGSIFSNSFSYQIGVMADYNSNYYAPQFAPSIEQFYWSTGEEQTYYPLIDFFLNARVRTVRFFLRSKHITQALFREEGIENVRNYPIPDRGVSFGVTWWFYD